MDLEVSGHGFSRGGSSQHQSHTKYILLRLNVIIIDEYTVCRHAGMILRPLRLVNVLKTNEFVLYSCSKPCISIDFLVRTCLYSADTLTAGSF